MEDLVKRSGSTLLCKECGQSEKTIFALDKHIYDKHGMIAMGGMVFRDDKNGPR